MSVHTPEAWNERLVELADEVMATRQRVAMECISRDRAVDDLARHLQVPDHDQRIAIVGDLMFCVARSGDVHHCHVQQIHAIARESP
jgi:hypothetical protein